MSAYADYLKHHGIKGQKWGVQNGPPYPLDRKTGSGSIGKTSNKSTFGKATNRKDLKKEFFKKGANDSEVKKLIDDEINKIRGSEEDKDIARRYFVTDFNGKLRRDSFIVNAALDEYIEKRSGNRTLSEKEKKLKRETELFKEAHRNYRPDNKLASDLDNLIADKSINLYFSDPKSEQQKKNYQKLVEIKKETEYKIENGRIVHPRRDSPEYKANMKKRDKILNKMADQALKDIGFETSEIGRIYIRELWDQM